MPKHLLLCASQYLPLVGGMERQIEFIATEFLRRGWLAGVVVPHRVRSTKRHEKVNGIEISRIASINKRFLQSISETISSFFFIFSKAFRKCDVLHCHNFCAVILVLAYAAVKQHKRVVITFHSHPHIPQKGTLSHWIFARIIKEIKIVVISLQIRECLLKTFPEAEENISLVYNGVDVERFFITTDAERELRRKELNLAGHTVAVLYVGRLSAEKGIDTLLDACRNLKDAANIVVLIAGKGPLQKEVQDAAAELPVIRYLGEVSDVAPLYHAADLYVLPSYREGMPVALLEAMACGLPSIATATPGSADVIEDGKDGGLVPVGDGKALAEKILAVVHEPEMLRNWSRRAAEKIRTRWSGNQEIDELERLFTED